VRAAASDFFAGVAPAIVSARFHNTLADATAALVAGADASRALPVVLTGGCFPNALLAERAKEALERDGRRVFLHRRVPPGDGGIALGQAAVANAIARTGGR
jgi:hydrogenase maturation protein HypF